MSIIVAKLINASSKPMQARLHSRLQMGKIKVKVKVCVCMRACVRERKRENLTFGKHSSMHGVAKAPDHGV